MRSSIVPWSMTIVCSSLKMSASSMIPEAMSLISRSRCAIAASLVFRLRCLREEVCWRVDWENDLSVSVSIMLGSVYGFCAGMLGEEVKGAVRPPRVRSSGRCY